MIVKYKYTRKSFIVYLFIMETDNGKEVSNSSVLARKKNGSKKCEETNKITEKIEGGIIVRRVDGRKVEPK